MTHTIPAFPNRADYDNPDDYDTAIERVLAADDWRNTTGQAIAGIDDALTAISTRVDTADTAYARDHAIRSLAAVIPILEQLADHLADPSTGDDKPPH